MLRQRGAVVIEADRIGHEVLEPGGAAFDEVAQRWPSVVVAGRVDRGRLAAIVFTDDEQLALLESITHPHIRNEIEKRVAASHKRDVVVELPLASDLMAGDWIRLVVVAPAAARLERKVSGGMAKADIENRMAAQPFPADWTAEADIVIDNSGSLADLENAVEAAWQCVSAAKSSLER